ncbi:MAG: glycosyl transferase family 36 [Planctomycetes bacterium]|nr:glycosyl transferase family 36 [Planctomycetota bacterium]
MSANIEPEPAQEQLVPAGGSAPLNSAGSLRDAPFSIEHLEEHARALAAAHGTTATHRDQRRMWREFESNSAILESVYNTIVAAARSGQEITPGSEWLLDNFYIVREQLREIREDLPRRFYNELPKLSAGPMAGAPRVYSLARELAAHTDSAIDAAMLTRFIQAYQEIMPLTIGEMWAIPIMLRLALVENLRRLADRLRETHQHRHCANAWADAIVEERPTDPPQYLSKQTRQSKRLAAPLVAQLVQRFRDQGHDLSTCWHWLEQRLVDEGASIEETVRLEHQRQACDQVSIGNAITTMRLMSAMDWEVFFEETSLVERELRQDPSDVYARMDFATRDRYRHVVELLARRSKVSELEVARRAVNESRRLDGDPLGGHVGYYLVDEGRGQLEANLGLRPSIALRVKRALAAHAQGLYVLTLVATWGLGMAALLGVARLVVNSVGALVLTFVISAVPLTELAVGIINYVLTLCLRPRVLPKFDFQQGIPARCGAVVVIPALVVSKESARALIERLEIHYLANPDPHLSFALLIDLKDAPEQSMPEDDSLLAVAAAAIEELNNRHAESRQQRFWLFHRQRRWNPSQNTWMGWERKRGKLAEFNRLLRGATDTSYVDVPGLPEELRRVRYVITLDADTQLPLGAARNLVRTLAHPLNQARFDSSRARVVRGYTILQPRISIAPRSARRSRFARIYSGNPHVDPYVTAISDVYQDAFGEGSFIGKGIYDLDAFEAATRQAFPDNQILSHDLIEGCHVRAGLVTDMELIDDYPAHYLGYTRRLHRWVRGDWQILPWLFHRVPSAQGAAVNPLSLISRWKILDNLRRSLVPPAVVLMLLAGWFVTPALAGLFTMLAMAVVALPLLIQALSLLAHRPRGSSLGRFLINGMGELRLSAAQALLALAFLAHQAQVMLDALIRSLRRVYFSRTHLLDWESAYVTERRLVSGWKQFLGEMWPASVLALVTCAALAVTAPISVLWMAAPILALWLVSPWLAYYVSQPPQLAPPELNDAERKELRRIARHTWLFFEQFVTADDNWLPPDNYQEHPKPVVAHRTSPTNEGMWLASTMTAHDFGYLGYEELAELLERNLDSWQKLEHHRGHPYNWHDTQTLAPLTPAYVSTVDSGNLAACALAVRQGLLALNRESFLGSRAFAGLADTLALTIAAMHDAGLADRRPTLARDAERLLRRVSSVEQKAPDTPTGWLAAWQELEGGVAALLKQLTAARPPAAGIGSSIPSLWEACLAALERQSARMRQEFSTFFPWVETLGRCPINIPAPTWLVEQRAMQSRLDRAFTLIGIDHLPEECADAMAALRSTASTIYSGSVARRAAEQWIDELETQIEAASTSAHRVLARYRELAERYQELALSMDFTFLFDQPRHLFSIGYNLATGQLDRSHYDLLESEARLASFLAVGKGDVDVRHWFHLGRPVTNVAGSNALLSWGGTMFEYLMPNLFLREYPETLLSESCRAAVDRQIEFGQQRNVPWGVSESAFAAFDSANNYQYRSFGVPGLGLKRGLADDLVVAPYATGLALMVKPREALANLRALAEEGALGPWGYYDAIDYTANRQSGDESKSIVQCYFAHHQGMLLVAAANCLLENRMQRRFHREPRTLAADRLLQEGASVAAPIVTPHGDELVEVPWVREPDRSTSRWITTPHTSGPRTQLLSNGKYTVMITNAGGGYSACEDTRLTRWRSDSTRDAWGQFIYLRDRRRGTLWSAGYQPTCVTAEKYEVLFSLDKAEFRRLDNELETHLEVAVSPENNAELRSLAIANHDDRPRTLDVTSYAEIVLGSAAADVAHPAFQKLFIETEYLAGQRTILARRRPRSAHEAAAWAIHVLAIDESQHPAVAGDIQVETDRARFLGRGGTVAAPAACQPGTPLSGTTGPVLDPIFSLRCPVRIAPGETVRLAFTTAYAQSREEALVLADQYREYRMVSRAFELAWAHAQVALRHVHLTAGNVHLFQRLASLLLYPDAIKRAPPVILAANTQGQAGLWRYGVSGDFPIVLVRISQANQDGLVREVLLAHEYWRSKNFIAEMVLLNEHPTSYMDAVHEQLTRLVGESGAWGLLNKRGGIFVLQGSRIPEADKTLLLTAAHVVLHGDAGSLERQLELTPQRKRPPALLAVSPKRPATPREGLPAPRSAQQPSLLFDNGYGGFDRPKHEYVIQLTNGKSTPAPWSNVIANATFGCVVTEAGGGFTWSENSRENKLTGWSNDPVSDPCTEAIYLRDDETGELWSPTPLPIRDTEPYTIRHGQGYSVFEHVSHGVAQSLLMTIAAEEPVKILRLTLRNESPRRRKLSATCCAEWILGVDREQMMLHVVTAIDRRTGALLATNHYHPGFAERVAFLHVVDRVCTVTGDRTEFFGRNGQWGRPAALERVTLSGRVGAGLDPFGAVQTRLDLEPGEESEVVFLLGQASSPADTEALLARFNDRQHVAQVAARTRQNWDDTLSAIQVQTPNPALDLLVNRWLLYQTLSCRFWGRSAFYQAGGAYGFRDQLQDSMALVYSRPELTREHLLRAAGRQFEEGDVQHWWHLPRGHGVRTRFSDDYLWLPFVAAHYLRTTGDTSLLHEVVPYLHSLPLEPNEHERYELPEQSAQSESFYGHCLRAIDRALRFGQHGLPLMGGGDWNDGMNKVGEGGRGESVWVAWFLLDVLDQFVPIVEAWRETDRAGEFRQQAARLRQAIEDQAWDGQWYRRAYFDDGTPLGSAQNDACQVDSIAQSWAVIANGDPGRARQGVQAAWDRLVQIDDKLALLFWPPFDHTSLEPGYIKGYLPGIRENGGQYTHAAIWLVQALAMLGDGNRAMQLFNLLAPPHHSDTESAARRYKVEPYVAVADVYSCPPHRGQGGWTWYTGSAAWMYRVAVEQLLGLRVSGQSLHVAPCVPADWAQFEITLRRGTASYHVVVSNPTRKQSGVATVSLDGKLCPQGDVPLIDDGNRHEVRVEMG